MASPQTTTTNNNNIFQYPKYPSSTINDTHHHPSHSIFLSPPSQPPKIHHHHPITSPPMKKQKRSPYNNPNADGTPRVYKCNFCDKHFSSSHGLGGHQNAHRRERAAARAAISPPPFNLSPDQYVTFNHSTQQYDVVHISPSAPPMLPQHGVVVPSPVMYLEQPLQQVGSGYGYGSPCGCYTCGYGPANKKGGSKISGESQGYFGNVGFSDAPPCFETGGGYFDGGGSVIGGGMLMGFGEQGGDNGGDHDHQFPLIDLNLSLGSNNAW